MKTSLPTIKADRKFGARNPGRPQGRPLRHPSSENNGFSRLMPENSCNIIERKKAEKALQESQKFVTSLLENAPHATVVINPDTSVRYVNPAWERLNGWTTAEAVGLKAPYPWWPKDISNEEFLPIYIEAIHQPVGKGEIIALKKNGEPYWIDMNWVSVTQDGEFQYAIINSVDITERKTMEAKRQAILQTALDGFWICDLGGKFLEVNDSYCTMTGYTREELLKMSIKDIEAIERPQETAQRIKKIIEQGGDRFETKHKRKDGRIIDMEISVKYHNIGEGQLTVFVRDITEHKKNQEALRESEEKFSKAFHVSPVMIAITSMKDGKFIDVNDSYTLSTGYSREELLGKPATDLRIWANADDRAKMFKILQEQGRVYNLEIDFRMKSGELRTWLFSAEPINISGEPCLIGVSFDITERKMMEESLANEAIRRRILIEQSRDGIVILDQDGAVFEANHRFAEMLDYSHEEVMRLHVWDWEYLYPPERVLEMIRTVDEAGDHFETQHLRKDGSVYNVEISTNGATFAGQKLIFCVCRDITGRKEVEAKLQTQRQLIESILATMREGVLVIDGNDRVILANAAAHAIFRCRNKALENKLLQDIIPVEQLLNLYQGVKLGKQEDNTLEFRYRVHNTDKIIVCAAIKMDEERTLLTFSDVSREREEKEKLYLTGRLASLGEMAAGLAHELNNPLTGILSLSQLLLDSDFPPEPKEDLRCIYSEAKRAANIVKNVLLFTRNNVYENGQASVNEVVRDVLRLREYEEKANNISVVTNFQEDLPDIRIDKYQLQQVFLNIILNAEAAIKEVSRPGVLTITTERINHHIHILFADNGCGIKKNILPRIFDPFFTTKDIGKGTGLGLSICYGIVSQHGGKISVKTQVNKGTTFTVRIPVAAS